VNSSKEKVEMGQFRPDSVPELNTKNLGNSLSFPSVTQITPFTKQFRSHGILNIILAAESCF
jgi:hypothetical protein